MAPTPSVVMVTMVYQKAAGMLVNLLAEDPFLSVEHDCGKDDDSHGEREEQEAQLWGTAFQRANSQDAQALRVAGKLKDPEDPEDAECHKGSTDILIVCHHQPNVIW